MTIDSGNYICKKETNTKYMFASTSTSGPRIVINGGNFRMESVGNVADCAMFASTVRANVQTVINGGTFSAVDVTYVFRGR